MVQIARKGNFIDSFKATVYHKNCPEVKLGWAVSPLVCFPTRGPVDLMYIWGGEERLEGRDAILERLEEFERQLITTSLEMAQSNFAKLRGESS